MKLVGIWHFSLNFQCLSLYVFLRQLFFSAPLRLYPYFNTACLVKRFFKLYERRGPRCHFDALRSSCDDKKTNRSCFLVVWWHLDSLNIRDIRRICSSERTNSCCLRIFRWVPHRHCLNLCQLSFWGISTPVILSHFQYLQVEHDSPDINAEVQRHQWHSSKKWCVLYALLWVVSKVVIEITTSIKEDWITPTKWSLISLAFYFCKTPLKPPSSFLKFACWTLTRDMSGQVGLEQSSGFDAHPGEVWNLDSKFLVFGDFLEVKLGFACRCMITNRG